MGILLFICISFFLVLFVVNNDPAAMLTSPLALGMAALALLADLYLARAIVRDWLHKRR